MGSRSSQSQTWYANKIKKLKRRIKRQQKAVRRLQSRQQALERRKREKAKWLRKFIITGANHAKDSKPQSVRN